MRPIVWDIESTSLNASFGRLLCVGWAEIYVGEERIGPVHITKRAAKDPAWDDSSIATEFGKVYDAAPWHVTYNGIRFDTPMLNTRRVAAGEEVPVEVPAVDLYYTVRRSFRLHSNRLAAVAEWMPLTHQKTPLDGDGWIRAAAGDPEALELVYDHCRSDVEVTGELYFRIRQLVRGHPRQKSDYAACRYCGGTKMVRRGRRFHALTPRVVVQCRQCGKYESRPERKGEV